MAHLWVTGDTHDWLVMPLDGTLFALDATPPRQLTAADVAAHDEAGLVLRRVDDPSGAWWVIVAGRDAQPLVNGASMPLGLTVLGDRDEIRLPDGRSMFFSTEMLARIEPFNDTPGRGVCPRCRQMIESGDAAVRCPICGLWHHETSELPCWTYELRCANPACSQATPLDAGFSWTPDEL